MDWPRFFKQGLYHLGVALLMMSFAFYNRYPFVYFDTGAYLEMAVNLEPSFHRAIGYPLLLKLTGWLISNWPIVLIQSLLVSWLLWHCFALFVNRTHLRMVHWVSVIGLMLVSSLPWYVNQLMPDVFTFMIPLSVAVLLFNTRLSARGVVAHALVLFIGLLVHLSHAPMLMLALISIWAARRWLFKNVAAVEKSRWIALCSVLIGAWLFTASYNAAFGYGFRYALSTNVFVTANLGEMGILKMYLDENCPNAEAGLCAMKDSLPLETGGYLWDVNGPIQNYKGGWGAANAAYAPIVQDFLFNPRYLKWFVIASAKATLKQLLQVDPASGLQYQYGEGSPVYWPMRTHYKQELNEFLGSVQNKGGNIPLELAKWLNHLALWLSILILGAALVQRALSEQTLFIFFTLCTFYFYNAAITGILANVYERLQARLTPLIIIMAAMAIIEWRSSAARLRNGNNEVGLATDTNV